MPASLARLLRPDRVGVGISAASKAEALDAVLELVARQPGVADPARLAVDVAAREALLSTGVGDGLALPHARTTAVTETVMAVCTLAEPVGWDAIDGVPVDLVVLFAGPEAARATHVQLLAHVSRVLSRASVRREMSEASTPEALLAVLVASE
ncbi:PTS sugar transporter subunit IIA [Rubrivirga sp. IMCC43871]|uniref:PTS sugar transporter subunit IIA n=1 Tax=Rubrivirga sp. IMCC43871 TaxID=3391575 RepID=UPI00398FCE88